MQEFIDKLIARLEEVKCIVNRPVDIVWNNAVKMCIYKAKELAEEYNHCTLCYLQSPCEYQNENAILPNELLVDKNGWIPCNERLPNKEEYLKDDGRFIVTDGNRRYQIHFDIYETQKFGIPQLNGFCEDKSVIAWHPLPQHYIPKGDNNDHS